MKIVGIILALVMLLTDSGTFYSNRGEKVGGGGAIV